MFFLFIKYTAAAPMLFWKGFKNCSECKFRVGNSRRLTCRRMTLIDAQVLGYWDIEIAHPASRPPHLKVCIDPSECWIMHELTISGFYSNSRPLLWRLLLHQTITLSNNYFVKHASTIKSFSHAQFVPHLKKIHVALFKTSSQCHHDWWL